MLIEEYSIMLNILLCASDGFIGCEILRRLLGLSPGIMRARRECGEMPEVKKKIFLLIRRKPVVDG